MADPVSVRPSWLKLSHDSAVVSEPRLGYPTHTGMIKTEREKISTAELDDVLQRARNQGWTSLALVSPDVAAAHDYLRQLELPAGRTYIVDGLPQSTVRLISKLRQLSSLALVDLQIGADGARARALASLTALTSLHLSNNQIGADGARALASLTALTSLTLSTTKSAPTGRGRWPPSPASPPQPNRRRRGAGAGSPASPRSASSTTKSATTGRGRWPPSPGSPRSPSTTTKSATTERGRCWKSGAIGPPRGIFIIST